MKNRLTALRQALRELYNLACHHPRCERSDVAHQCSCGLSAALEQARKVLELEDYSS